ncbi:MAG: hypothetical protein AAGI44_20060, partial [Pseudomonadota bacterium]
MMNCVRPVVAALAVAITSHTAIATPEIQRPCGIPPYQIKVFDRNGNPKKQFMYGENFFVEQGDLFKVAPIGDYLGHYAVGYFDAGKPKPHEALWVDASEAFSLPCVSRDSDRGCNHVWRVDDNAEVRMSVIYTPCQISD